MTIFEAIKSMVTPRMAAELSINRNGMACCHFHDDRHPSMELQPAGIQLLQTLNERQHLQPEIHIRCSCCPQTNGKNGNGLLTIAIKIP